MNPRQLDVALHEQVLAGLRLAESCQYGWDEEADSYGLWSPESKRFLIHVPKDAMDLAPYRAEIITATIAGWSESEHDPPRHCTEAGDNITNQARYPG